MMKETVAPKEPFLPSKDADDSASPFFTELVNDLETLEKIEAPWRALANRTLVTNPNFAPDIFLATFTAFSKEFASKGCILVWRREDASKTPTLVGFLPCRVQRFRWGIPLPALNSWTQPHVALGIPLLDKRCAREALTAILAHAAQLTGPAGILIMEEIDGEGVFADLLRDVLETHHLPSSVPYSFERATFESDVDFDEYQLKHYNSKSRQTYRRKRKKLAELGELETVFLRTWSEIEPELDAFLELEGSGWKRRQGSALICDENSLRWYTELVRRTAQAGDCLFSALKLNGERMLAGAVVDLGGNMAGLGKIAYDEDMARYSPGGLLMLDTLREVSESNGLDLFDSYARPENTTLYKLFKQRRLIEHRIIGLTPNMTSWRFLPFATLESLRRRAGPRIKSVINRLRRG